MTMMNSIRTATNLGILIALTSSSITLAGAPTIITVIRTGNPVPGMPGFTFSGTGSNASINDAGIILCTATITGPGTNGFNDHVLVKRDASGVLTILAREADPVPGLPGFIYRGGSANTPVFTELVVTPTGVIGVVCETLQGINVRDMIMIDDSETNPNSTGLTVVTYETAPIPGFDPADTLTTLEPTVPMHDNGFVGFSGRVGPVNVVDAVWFGGLGGLTASLQSQLQAPDQPIGVIISSFDRSSFEMNESGRMTFGVLLALGNGITQANRRILYAGQPNTLGVLAQTGSPIPGMPGATYGSIDFDSARINSAGAIVYKVNPAGVTPQAIMTSGSGVTVPLVLEGDPIPDLPGMTIDLANPRLEMNNSAEVVFTARITGAPTASDTGLFVATPGTLRLILREGDEVGGNIVESIANNFTHINDRGDVLVEVNADGRKMFMVIPGDGSPSIKLARSTEVFVSDDGFVAVLGALVPWRFDARNGSTGNGMATVMNNEGQFVISILTSGDTGTFLIDFDGEPPCIADITGDGILNFFDVSAFLTALVAMDPAADINDDGVVNFFDVSAFLIAFGAGCP